MKELEKLQKITSSMNGLSFKSAGITVTHHGDYSGDDFSRIDLHQQLKIRAGIPIDWHIDYKYDELDMKSGRENNIIANLQVKGVYRPPTPAEREKMYISQWPGSAAGNVWFKVSDEDKTMTTDIKKIAEQCTIEELKKAIEIKEANSNKPVKEGFLKGNLYTFDPTYSGQPTSFCIESVDNVEDYFLMSCGDVEKVMDKFEKCFNLFAMKDTRFVCYLQDGEESWYDDANYGIEGMSPEWADKHLRGINPLK